MILKSLFCFCHQKKLNQNNENLNNSTIHLPDIEIILIYYINLLNPKLTIQVIELEN